MIGWQCLLSHAHFIETVTPCRGLVVSATHNSGYGRNSINQTVVSFAHVIMSTNNAWHMHSVVILWLCSVGQRCISVLSILQVSKVSRYWLLAVFNTWALSIFGFHTSCWYLQEMQSFHADHKYSHFPWKSPCPLVRIDGNFHFWFGRNPEKCPNNFIRGSSHEPQGIPRFPLVFSLPITYEISMYFVRRSSSLFLYIFTGVSVFLHFSCFRGFPKLAIVTNV